MICDNMICNGNMISDGNMICDYMICIWHTHITYMSYVIIWYMICDMSMSYVITWYASVIWYVEYVIWHMKGRHITITYHGDLYIQARHMTCDLYIQAISISKLDIWHMTYDIQARHMTYDIWHSLDIEIYIQARSPW